MGASCGAVAFKTDTSKWELSKIISDLFGKDFTSGGYCDSRESNCIYIGKTKDYIVITNSDFTDKFFRSKDTSIIDKYQQYFSNPEFVFAFEEYDSGGSYGYSLIYNGQVKRQLRTESYEKVLDFGEPEAKELKWLQAETIIVDEGDGEMVTYYKDTERDFKCTADQLPQVMLQELMLEKLGFITWNMDEFFIEQGHYKK
jgi:hypothetical protein